jgi:arsenate reductase
MNKIYHLANCNTCQRIIAEVSPLAQFELQNIREEKITPSQLDELAKVVGSYEALFSRKALKFRTMGLHEQTLTETDYRKLILQEDTFLKRPVIVVGKKVFVGNAKKTIEEVKTVLTN